MLRVGASPRPSSHPAPEFAEPESVPLRRLYSISPLAMLGMGLQGMTASMTFGLAQFTQLPLA